METRNLLTKTRQGTCTVENLFAFFVSVDGGFVAVVVACAYPFSGFAP
jgi:hypothetical protein